MLALKEIAYCTQCEKNVKVVHDTECDERGEQYSVALCGECLCAISHCYDCDLWHPDSEHTPLGETLGTCMRLRCPPDKRRVHAMNLVCRWFKEGERAE